MTQRGNGSFDNRILTDSIIVGLEKMAAHSVGFIRQTAISEGDVESLRLLDSRLRAALRLKGVVRPSTYGLALVDVTRRLCQRQFEVLERFASYDDGAFTRDGLASPPRDRKEEFARLCKREPRLLQLLNEVTEFQGNSDPKFCANDAWYGFNIYPGIKPRLLLLVGHDRPGTDAGLRSSYAYDLATSVLSELLPECRDCGCMRM